MAVVADGESTTLMVSQGTGDTEFAQKGMLKECWGLKTLLKKAGAPNKVNLLQGLHTSILLYLKTYKPSYLFSKGSK